MKRGARRATRRVWVTCGTPFAVQGLGRTEGRQGLALSAAGGGGGGGGRGIEVDG